MPTKIDTSRILFAHEDADEMYTLEEVLNDKWNAFTPHQ
jgi:hypothetical protein